MEKENDGVAVGELIKMIRDLSGEFKSLSGDFHNQANLLIETNRMVEDTKRSIERLFNAFPDRDPDGHRIKHEQSDDAAEDAKKFRQMVRNGLVLFGIPAVLTAVASAVWAYIKIEIHK